MKTKQNLSNGCNISSICCKNSIVWSFFIVLAQMSLYNSVQTKTSKLSDHVHNFMMISPMLFRWHNKSIESNLRWAHRFRKWLVAYSTASHYLNQCLVNWTDRQNISVNFWCLFLFVCLFCFVLIYQNTKTKIHPRKSISWCRLQNGDHFGPWRYDLKWGNGKILNPFIQVF